MPDVMGDRVKFGVTVPSTNTVVEADYNGCRLPGEGSRRADNALAPGPTTSAEE